MDYLKFKKMIDLCKQNGIKTMGELANIVGTNNSTETLLTKLVIYKNICEIKE